MNQPDLWANATVPGKQATSKAAARKAFLSSGTLRLAVFEHIASCGESGASDLEIQQRLNLNGSTQRPRRIELKNKGLIQDSEQRRGGSTVWKLTDYGWRVFRHEEDVAA